LAALAGWRTVAAHLEGLQHEQAGQEARAVLEMLPQPLRSAPSRGEPALWTADPIGLHRSCEAAVRRLAALPVERPSLQLLADRTIEVLAGISDALDGLTLLAADPARPVPRGVRIGIRVPDWLPSLVNAGRAFLTFSAVAVFWVVTEWPSGAQAMAFAAIGVILVAPRADQAYGVALGFTIGTSIGAILAAIIAFAVLPKFETFAALAIAIGVVLVPAGAGVALSWQTPVFTGLAAWFIPLLGPANQMNYNTVQFYNTAVAIVGGIGVAALSFRLILPLSPRFRARRLMALSLRDLSRLAAGTIAWQISDWRNRIYGRFSVLPDEAQPLQRSQLLAALSVGAEMITLRAIASQLDLVWKLDPALEVVARGNGALASARLADLDQAVASFPGTVALHARASILAVSEALTRHAVYFDAGVPSEVH